eukprot:6474884-Lingulodinium_polyedra.AAC.1
MCPWSGRRRCHRRRGARVAAGASGAGCSRQRSPRRRRRAARAWRPSCDQGLCDSQAVGTSEPR